MPLIPRTATAGQSYVINGVTSLYAPGDVLTLQLDGDDIQVTVPKVATPTPVPVPTPAPTPSPLPSPPGEGNTVSVGPGELQQAIESATSPRDLIVTGAQTISKQVNVRTSGLTIRSAVPGQRVKVKIVAGDGLYNGITCGKQGLVLADLHFWTDANTSDRKKNSATPIAFTAGGGGTVSNCYADNVDQFIKLDTACKNVSILNTENTASCLGQGVWGGGTNILIDGCTFRSRIEHPIRFGGDGDPKWNASNVTIRSCMLIQTSSKECLSIRKGAGPFTVQKVTCQRTTPADPKTPGYALRLGYENGHGEPALGPVTLDNVTIVNGVLDVKATAKSSKLVFNAVKFTGKANSPNPLWLNGATNAVVKP